MEIEDRKRSIWTIKRPDDEAPISSSSMTLKTSMQASSALSPKVIVLLVGWWGAKPKDIGKYSALYHGMMPCVTVAGVADSTDIMFKREEGLKRFALNGLETVDEVHSEYDALELPVVVHLFSNGGGFVWQHMLKILDESDDSKSMELQDHVPQNTASDTNHVGSATSPFGTERIPLHRSTRLSELRTNIKALIMDSCPAYPKLSSGMAALEGSLNGKATCLLPLVKAMFFLFHASGSLWNWLWCRPSPLKQFWNELLTSSLKVPQAFVYSTVDRMVDHCCLEDFIETRRNSMAHDVSVLKFNDTPHVQHYRYYPNEYKAFVNNFLTQCLH